MQPSPIPFLTGSRKAHLRLGYATDENNSPGARIEINPATRIKSTPVEMSQDTQYTAVVNAVRVVVYVLLTTLAWVIDDWVRDIVCVVVYCMGVH